uniref:DUF4206 domain-containing protein n=1 Tax=Parastrongyloides trichosuri TaxID=131310 RepID=A0A0N4ZGM3_PARTI
MKAKSDNFIDIIDFMISKMESKRWNMFVRKNLGESSMNKYNIEEEEDENETKVNTLTSEIYYSNNDVSSDSDDTPTSDQVTIKDIYVKDDKDELKTIKETITKVSKVFIDKNKKKYDEEGKIEVKYFEDLSSNPETIFSTNKKNDGDNKINDTLSFFVDKEKLIIQNPLAWKPLKARFIFTAPSSSGGLWSMLSKQNYRCSGCGFYFTKLYGKRAQYCNYYGLFFCQCCFQGLEVPIPGNILKNWNFKPFPVSDLAFNFLMKNRNIPIYDIKKINNKLYDNVKRLRQMRDLRYQLKHLWEYVKLCSIARKEESPYGELGNVLKEIPERFLQSNINLYALSDFSKIATKQLILYYRPIISFIRKHVEECFHCRERAFFCECCHDSTEYLFPFQIEKIARCTACGGLFHLRCYEQKLHKFDHFDCPKCKRMEERQELMERSLNFY